ncbi:hypothetical protein DM02DRAFT_635722 [Periconia macrospinosa]|uniref:Uncharacterized protein n=1 Tax=Periconia macrospinosa TaxID=97972 RepID=A0A2V1D446_9PLEO|nr:hypothetical protein DM02DRAFT_635722 [Periconia macrospinosa]
MFFLLHSLAAIVTFSTITNAYTVSNKNGLSCRGANLNSDELKPDSGCRQPYGSQGASALVKPAGEDKDFGNVVVFFSSDDCNPANIVKDGEGFMEEGCFTVNFRSYEVWNLWKVEVFST